MSDPHTSASGGSHALDYRALFERSPGLYLILQPDLTIVGMSDAYAAATMIDRTVVGRNLFDVFPDNPDDPTADGENNLRASLDHVLRTRTEHAMAIQKYDIRRPDGSFEVRYWSPLNKPVLSPSNELLWITHSVVDVTEFVVMREQQVRNERKTEELQQQVARMELASIQRSHEIQALNHDLERRVAERTEEVRRSEQGFHSVLNTMMDGVVIIDPDWRCVYANNTAVARAGGNREQLLGRTAMEAFPYLQGSPLFDVMQRCMQEGAVQEIETEFVYPDGKHLHLAVSVQPVAEGILLRSADITHRKQIELALEQRNQQVEAQNKELEQFTYIASHDLHEPLRMVSSFVQLLDHRYKDKLDPEAREFIAFALEGATRMSRLINDLLAFSRVGRSVERTEVDMDSVLDHVLLNLRPAIIKSGCVIERTKLPTVLSVETEMIQLFQNLISNAIKFRQPDVKPLVRITCQDEGTHWRFDVSDNGIGIDERHRDAVFVPFKRLNERAKYEGSGIGLAVAHKIVKRHDGHIWFDSAPLRGASFHFTLKR